MEYYSAIEKNEIMLLGATWTDLECHAEGSQSEGEVSYNIPYMQNLKKKMIQMNLFTKQKQT